MSFVPERVDAGDKFTVHDDGRMPFTALGGPWHPIAQWFAVEGEAPDAARFEAALGSFRWRGGKDLSLASGHCMLSTPMDGVYLEIMPGARSYLDRLGFSISGSLSERYFDELEEAAEAERPGYRDRVARFWSEDAEVRDSAVAEAKALAHVPSLPISFARVVANGIEEALSVTLAALSEACSLVPDNVVEPSLDDVVGASRRRFLESVYPRRTEGVSDASPRPFA